MRPRLSYVPWRAERCRRGSRTPSTATGPAPANRSRTRSPWIVAVGVNCCAPTDVERAVRIARDVTDKPIVAYPNSGEGWVGHHWTGESTFDVGLVAGWLDAGARAVGGCCRVTPVDIVAIARATGH